MLRALAHEGGDRALEERLEDADAVARIHTIAHLADGQPRLWALLGSVLTVDQVDYITDLLLTRFDDLTPITRNGSHGSRRSSGSSSPNWRRPTGHCRLRRLPSEWPRISAAWPSL